MPGLWNFLLGRKRKGREKFSFPGDKCGKSEDLNLRRKGKEKEGGRGDLSSSCGKKALVGKCWKSGELSLCLPPFFLFFLPGISKCRIRTVNSKSIDKKAKKPLSLGLSRKQTFIIFWKEFSPQIGGRKRNIQLPPKPKSSLQRPMPKLYSIGPHS